MSLEQFKGKYIPILDWKFFDNDQEENEYRDSYDIDDNYKLLGTTIVGDVLALKNGWILEIDHEDPIPENDYKRTKDLPRLTQLLTECLQIPDYEDTSDIKELKRIKEMVKNCKKLAPKNLKHHFEDLIDDIKTEIDFLK